MRSKNRISEDINKSEIIKKVIKRLNTEGFYLVLFICFCIVAAVTVWTVKTNINRIGNINDEENVQFVEENNGNDMQLAEEDEVKQTLIQEENSSKTNNPLETNDSIVISKESTNDESDSEQVISSQPFLSTPVEGPVCLNYTDNTLIYSKTLDQYILHKGIDIEAPLSTPVCAAADGIVTKVEENKQMGITIWIEHKNNIATIYSNLSTMEMVSKGDTVKKGDVISGVGDTAIFEILEVPHLHFEVMRNGSHENPLNFLNLK